MEGMSPRPTRLDDSAVTAALTARPGWERDGDTIRKSFTLESFADAVAFVVRVGFDAEAMNHHPDLDVRWRTVHVALSTHDAGGLTELDFELAGRIDAAAS
jgi:4a-hydroxytetrahydrobiopterin dehydratase